MLAERLLAPVRAAEVDTLVLGCTHYPLLARTIGDVMGRDVVLVSSADETAFDGAATCSAASGCAGGAGTAPTRTFVTSGDVETFRRLGHGSSGPRSTHVEAWSMELTVLGCSGSYGAPGRRRVQRLPRPRRATRRSGSTAATARSRTCSSTSTVEDLERGRHHPRAPRPLRRHLRAARAAALRPRAARPARVRARRARAARSVARRRRLGRHVRLERGRRRRHGTTVGDIALRFSRTDHPPPTYAVEVAGRRQAARVHRRHRARSGRVDAFGAGADLVLSEATYLHDQTPGADPPLGARGRRAARARRRRAAARCSPTCGRGSTRERSVEEGSEAFGERRHARRAAPQPAEV